MSDDRAQIENLMARYCRTFDDGDVEAYVELFKHGDIIPPEEVTGGHPETAESHFHNCHMYDGKPNTRHVITNIHIEIDSRGKSASAESYVTVYQATRDFRSSRSS